MASLWNSMFDLLPEWQWSDRLCWTTQNLESLLAQCLWHWHRNLISKNSHNTVKEQIWCHVCCSNIENMTTSDRLTLVTAKVHNSTKTLECFDNIALTEFNCVHCSCKTFKPPFRDSSKVPRGYTWRYLLLQRTLFNDAACCSHNSFFLFSPCNRGLLLKFCR